MVGVRRLAALGLAASLAAGLALVGSGAASAAVIQQVGYTVSPAQPYLNDPDAGDWIGSYLVGGTQLWGADFAYGAPTAARPTAPVAH